MTYNRVYRNPKWLEFRRKMIDLANGLCENPSCDRSAEDGAILQVHHDGYDRGRDYWDYKKHEVRVLCMGCHAVEHAKIPPRFGWQVIDWQYFKDRSGQCDYGHTDLMQLFHLWHPFWPQSFWLGSECTRQRLFGGDDLKNTLNNKFMKLLSAKQTVIESDLVRCRIRKIDVRVVSERQGYRVFIDGVRGRYREGDRIDILRDIHDGLCLGRLQEFIGKVKDKKLIIKLSENKVQ